MYVIQEVMLHKITSMENTNKNLIEKEYFHLQNVIESFDAKSLTIKAWSVTLATAIASSSAFKSDETLLLFASLASLMFWFIDGFWKTFQYANYRRSGLIEKFMRGEKKTINSLQIGTSWGISNRNGGNKRLLKILFWPHVLLPHAAMFILLLAIYVYQILT